ncbi:patatin-like phospholipase family protein [Pseudomonas sp. Marseille-Q1929]|uniref:patatin-like phospholipase family protein n=1 Tax=Pseudomonas sp. Marseille-Q1929 TaxID=2730402 RepID=UPI001A8D6E43|nr:patatin-like phospholipase family protein [Pseudomonas sp. Marseille-Q1929]MBO0492595.1 patatin-like phospholipase family protein [Pseudomonas sp. Marseille-Q1929]
MKVSNSSVQTQAPAPHTIDQSVKAPLLENVGPRKLSLHRHNDGRVDVDVSPPPPSHLVLSGGGAKGIAFPGMVQALEEGKKLQGVKVISGSSAGAISSTLLASGMNAKTFGELSNSLDLPSLLNSKDPVTAWLQNISSELGKLAGRLPGAAGNITQLLLTMLPRLQTEASPLEEMMRNESRKSILAHIADMPRETRPGEVMKIADRLSAGGGPTFRDLEVLSRHIPAIKQLNITGTGMFDGRPQLVVFNASLAPDMDIARAARISGSLPGLFKSPQEQGHGFQQVAEVTAFQDGGLLANTPAPGVVGSLPPQGPLNQPESLVVKFESDETTPKKSGGFISSIVDKVTGTPHASAGAYQAERLKAYADQTVTLPLNTEKGDFRGMFNGTVNFTMTPEQKQHLQAKANQAVTAHLETREKSREKHSFASMEDAVLAMDDSLLASVQEPLKKDPAAADALMFRKSAQQALQALDSAVSEANRASDVLTITPKIAAALRNLDALARRPEHVEWLGQRLNAVGQHNFQQLMQVAAKATSGTPMSKVMSSAVAEMKRRDIAVKAENFTREVIYPSLYRPGQPASNVELLHRVAAKLAKATTPGEFNAALEDIVQNYKARNKPWSKPFKSTTVEMAKAWRIPLK